MGHLFSVVSQFLDQALPPPSKFSVDDIPDLTGRVVLVTGGNTGIGKETCRALLQKNARVYLAARSQARALETIRELEESTGKIAVFLRLDLAELKSVKRAADEFLSKEKELHVLFNNAGVMIPPIDQLTADGYDLQFGTNVLGHFYLTKLLLPTLIASARDAVDGKARIVHTSSFGHVLGALDFETLCEGRGGATAPARNLKRHKLGRHGLYSQSKFGNVVIAREIARRYADRGIVSTSCNPGNIKTELQRHVGPLRLVLGLFLYPARLGAITQLYAGTSRETADANGQYFIPWARLGQAIPETDDPELGRRLWEWCEAQLVDNN